MGFAGLLRWATDRVRGVSASEAESETSPGVLLSSGYMIRTPGGFPQERHLRLLMHDIADAGMPESPGRAHVVRERRLQGRQDLPGRRGCAKQGGGQDVGRGGREQLRDIIRAGQTAHEAPFLDCD